MKKKIFMLLFMSIIFITGSYNVNANEINNFYIEADEEIKIEESINGETAVAGTIVDILGNIDGIGFLAGETVNQKGNIEYGFIAGNQINISGNTEKSLFAIGTQIDFTKNSNIGRDTFLIGDTINLNGKYQRDLNIKSTIVTIKKGTTIYGDLTIEANKINIEDNVMIYGTLEHNDDATTTISDNETLVTDIEKYTIENEANEIDTNTILSSLLNFIIVFLVIAIVLPKTIEKTNDIYKKQNLVSWCKNIAFGFLLLIIIPIICLLLLISNIGIALGLILTALYVIAIYLAYILSGYIFGNIILRDLLKLKTNIYFSGIIGIILIKILTMMPIINGAIIFIVVTIGMTTIWKLIIENETPKNNEIKEADITIKKEEKMITEKTVKETPKKTTTKKTTAPKKATTPKKTTQKKEEAKKETPKKTTTRKTTTKKETKAEK